MVIVTICGSACNPVGQVGQKVDAVIEVKAKNLSTIKMIFSNKGCSFCVFFSSKYNLSGKSLR